MSKYRDKRFRIRRRRALDCKKPMKIIQYNHSLFHYFFFVHFIWFVCVGIFVLCKMLLFLALKRNMCLIRLSQWFLAALNTHTRAHMYAYAYAYDWNSCMKTINLTIFCVEKVESVFSVRVIFLWMYSIKLFRLFASVMCAESPVFLTVFSSYSCCFFLLLFWNLNSNVYLL